VTTLSESFDALKTKVDDPSTGLDSKASNSDFDTLDL